MNSKPEHLREMGVFDLKEKTMPDIEINKASREKNWSEMTSEERIDKLERELEQTQKALKRALEYLTKLIDHKHLDGRMVSVIEHPGSESFGGFHFRCYERK